MVTRAEAEAKWGPKLPDAVKAQAERATNVQAQMAEGQIVAEAVPVTTETPKPPLTVVTPTPETVTPPVQTPPAPPPVQVTGEDWQAKYSVLQGKYNAEIPALQEAMNKANRTIEHLNSLLETALAAKATPTPAAPAAPEVQQVTPSQEISAMPLNLDDFEGYGEEVVSLARMTQENNALLRDLKNQFGETKQIVTQSAEDRFYDALDAALPPQQQGQQPYWEILNKDPGFLEWLQGVDDLSGEIRHHLLTKHFNALNAPKVLAFFRTYLQVASNPVNPPGEAPVQVVVPNFQTPTVVEPLVPMANQSPLASQVVAAPTTSGPPAPTPGQVPVVTRQQFLKAVQDYTQGRIDEAEYTRIANAFQNSIQQGRV